MKTIASALVKARRQFGPALKDKSNPHFRSKYADLGACLDAVDDALLEQGIALAQETDKCEDGVMVRTVLIHESGERMDFGWLHVPAAKHDPQGYGSALTYARRYSLMAACGIAPEDDDGNAASKPRHPALANDSMRSSPLMTPDGKRAIEELPQEQQDYLKDLAMEIVGLVRDTGGPAAHQRLQKENLDNEQRMGLWSILDSKTRTALTKARQPIAEAA